MTPQLDNYLHPEEKKPARQLVCVGKCTGAFGVHGQVRIKSYCSNPRDIANYQPLYDQLGQRQYEIQLVRTSAANLLATINCVQSRKEAENLKGLQLFADRNSFPPAEADDFYQTDLIGLRIFDVHNQPIGTVRAILNHGAGDLLEIIKQKGETLYVPFTKLAVPVVDLVAGRIIIDWRET